MKREGKKEKKEEEKYAIIFIVEGDTEAHFYEHVLNIFELKQKFKGDFKIINSKGVSKIQNKGLNKCRDYIKTEKISTAYVFVCYDNDVFHRGQKPPLDYNKLKKELSEIKGIEWIGNIVAIEQIEDWFLLDLNGICTYLNIKAGKLIGTGEDKLKQLFKKAHKVYVKGENIDNGKFIKDLNKDLLTKNMQPQLKKIHGIIASVSIVNN